MIVFAGPNGSGKTTITKLSNTIGDYINADDIKRVNLCSDVDAALKAEEMREKAVREKRDFTFDTVLSTDRNLKLLQKAKANGYFVRCIYVLTANPDINVARKPFRIFKKRKDQIFYWENDFWDKERIKKITGITESELASGVKRKQS